MAEWSNAPVLKTDEGESPPRVRIPVPPPPAFAAGTAPQNTLIFWLVSAIYKRVLCVMLSVRLRYWLIVSLYSEAHFSKVGFPCFFELTGKLTGNIFVFKLQV